MRRARSRVAPSRARRLAALIIVQNLPVPLDRRVWQEALALRDAGWDVCVICPRGTDEPRVRNLAGVRIYTYAPPPPSRGVAGFVREFAECWLKTARLSVRAWRERRFVVIQACNPPDTYWLLARLWALVGVRFLFDQHDLCPEVYEDRFGRRNMLYRTLLLLERATYRSAHALVATNESYRQVAVERGNWMPEEVAIVRSAPDPTVMRRTNRDPSLHRGRAHLLVYLGIMGPQDGVDRLLLAMRHLVHVRGRRDVHLALLGFGDCLDDLRRLSRECRIDDVCEFVGRADQTMVQRWLSSADIAVAPDPPSEFNDRSTMNKVLEYMAYSLPVVMYDLTENRHSTGSEAARVVSPPSPEALGDALDQLLDAPECRVRMGAAGRARIEQELRWDRQAPTYVAAFERALTVSRRGGTRR